MREDIVSVTLSEVSLVLLFLIIIVSYADKLSSRQDSPPQDSKISMKDLVALQESLHRNQAELERVRMELTILHKEESKEKLKSKQRPSCIEQGITDGFLETVSIVAVSQYSVAEQIYSFSEIKRYFKEEIAFAESSGCVHAIKVYHGSGITLDAYLKSLKKLERLFYIKRIKGD